jgi:hypothetical protein
LVETQDEHFILPPNQWTNREGQLGDPTILEELCGGGSTRLGRPFGVNQVLLQQLGTLRNRVHPIPNGDGQCRNPTLAKCGGEAQHLEKLGDLESSGTPECSELDSKGQNTLHWGVLGVVGKGLETYISKMPSHWQFGHLQPKLWAKEGPGVKLAV